MDRREFIKSGIFGMFAMIASPWEILKEYGLPEKGAGAAKKGVIFFVFDGCPNSVLTATFVLMQKKFQEQPYLLKLMRDPRSRITLMNTASLDSLVTDSAAATVAWATGSKTVNGHLAVLPDGRSLKTVVELAKDKGLSVGFVTTTRVTHATPAGWYSHNPDRDDEEHIAEDIIKVGVDVLMGGGAKYFSPEKRKDGKDLCSFFEKEGYKILRSRDDLKKIDDSRILGLFSSSHLSYVVDRLNDPNLGQRQPSLGEMTARALSILSNNEKGFILQVEAGRVDHANHANDAYAAMMECYEGDKALGVVLKFIEHNPEWLLVVTSDHGNSAYGINGCGPEYRDTNEAIMKYENTASFERMIELMEGKDVNTIKDIFEYHTKTKISLDEAVEIWQKLNDPEPNVVVDEFEYEPQATMGRILRASKYEVRKGSVSALLRRGNIGFTCTNHTGEDQWVVIHGPKKIVEKIRGYMDNTELFSLMCEYLGIVYKNPVMAREEARAYLREMSSERWVRHKKLHIA